MRLGDMPALVVMGRRTMDAAAVGKGLQPVVRTPRPSLAAAKALLR